MAKIPGSLEFLYSPDYMAHTRKLYLDNQNKPRFGDRHDVSPSLTPSICFDTQQLLGKSVQSVGRLRLYSSDCRFPQHGSNR